MNIKRVIKIGLNAGALSKKKGVEKGPDKIADCLNEFHTSEAGQAPNFEISQLMLDNNNLEGAHAQIESGVAKLLTIPGSPILLGGDHSLTYASFKAFAQKNHGAGLIVLDAHPDVEDCQKPPTHEDYLRALLEDGILEPDKVVLIGVRNASREEKKYLELKKIKNYSMREIGFESLQEVTDNAMSVAREWPSAYLSIDIDVLDPAFAPGTGYCEPGGLTAREILYVLQRLKLLRNLLMADLVEVNPDKDVNGMTAKLSAKIIVELS